MTAPSATSFTFNSTGPYANAVWTLDTSQNTTNSRFYEKNGDPNGTKGIEIRLVSGTTRLYVNTGSNTSEPFYVSVNDPFAINNQDVAIANTNTVYFADNYNTTLGTLTITSNHLWTSGPTVTSITADKIFVPSDTVSNTDFTLLKNGSAYANTNISLTGPGAQPPSDARGYTYNLTYDGTAYYRATIDSKSYEELYYDDSWTSSPSSGRSTTSNRILNVLGTIPANTSIESGGNTLTSVSSNNARTLKYSYTADLSSINLSANTTIDIIFFVEQKLVNNVQEIVGAFYEIHTANSVINAWTSSPVYIIGNQETMTYTQNLMGVATTFSVQDWIYSDEPEGDGYVAPVTTTSNGGGRPDRYPLIMTNLFNRNRSLYSIGMTHKDTWDLFL